MTTIPLPAAAAIEQAVRQLRTTPAETRAIDKAAWHLLRGIEIVAVAGGLLVPGSKGDVYRVSATGECSCPAMGLCYHQMIVKIIETAHAQPSHTMPNLMDTLSKAERLIRAKQEMSELFS